MKTNFYIGEVSRKTGLNPKTIRFWEEIGLLPKPKRTKVNHGNGYRLFGEDDIQRLQFLKRAKLLELSLKDMKQLLEVAETGCCLQVSPTLQTLVGQKTQEIDQKIEDLKSLKRMLENTLKNFKNSNKIRTNCIREECL